MNDILTSFLPFVIPIISLFIGAYFQKQRDKLLIEQETFFQKKRENYSILMISNGNNPSDQDKLRKKILSQEYRKEILSLNLYGNDRVVKAFNNLFQLIYDHEKFNENPILVIPLVGSILVEMRKELGNKTTQLDEFSILEFLIKDIKQTKKDQAESYRKLSKYLKDK